MKDVYKQGSRNIYWLICQVFLKKNIKIWEGKTIMQLYQFEKIYTQMEREFGKIRKGEEETYAMLLLPMEGNVLKIHREFPESNSRRLREAIALALFDVKGNYSGEKYDTGNFRNEENERLEEALLMAFDPYRNKEIMELLKKQFQVDTLSQEQVKEYYKFPVMCLLRIKESVDTWEKHSGSNGYFDFIEGYMGREITGNDMNYSIMSSGVLDM